MKKLNLKILTFILAILIFNFAIGIIRLKNGDFITFKKNIFDQFLTERAYKKEANKTLVLNQLHYDMSQLKHNQIVVKKYDAFGFSNSSSNYNPDVLLIGDSFMDDPFISTNSGFQNKINSHFKKNITLNIASMGCSGFSVFNDLREKGYFKKCPKYIFFEVVERNVHNVLPQLYVQLAKNIKKTKKYNYYYMDLILGNNFENIFSSSLFQSKKDLPIGFEHHFNNKSIWFYKNIRSDDYLDKISGITETLKKVTSSFEKKGCKIIFILAPDKESLYPDVFGKSNLPQLNESLKINGIKTIDIFEKITQQPNPKSFYFDGDTHWNQKAVTILVNEIITTITSLENK